MANTLRIKRRLSGATGAPAALKSGELAWNMMDGVIYAGKGDDGNGNATSVVAIAKDTFDPSAVFQTADLDLTALAALAANGVAVRTSDGTWAVRTITGTAGRVTITNGDGVAGAPTIDLATVAVGGSVAGGYTKFIVDAYGRITNAGQASLSDLSAPTGDIAMGNNKLTGLATPTNGTDAATKGYVDAAIQGLDPKTSVRVATVSNIALTGTQTIDGIAVVATDRVLVKSQTNATENGIYVAAAGAWTRANDADTWAELQSGYVFIQQGGTHGDQGWVCTADAGGILGTTAVNWVQFSGAGSIQAGNGLTLTGTTLDINVANGVAIVADNVQLTGQALALHQVTTAADQLIYATGAGAFSTAGLSAFARTFLDDTNAAGVQATLGLTPGTHVQAYNARLNNLAGLAISTADNIVLFGATNAASALTLGATGKALLDDATPAAARTTLGVTIGTDVQAYDAGLQSIAGLTTLADKMIYTTASDTYATATLTSFARTILDDVDAAASRTTLGLVIGTDIAAYNARVAALAGLAITTADNIVLYGAANAASTLTLTATGKALMTAVDAAGARTTLGLGSMALQNANAIAVTGGTIDNVMFDGGVF